VEWGRAFEPAACFQQAFQEENRAKMRHPRIERVRGELDQSRPDTLLRRAIQAVENLLSLVRDADAVVH
jgi:hypothetical protein